MDLRTRELLVASQERFVAVEPASCNRTIVGLHMGGCQNQGYFLGTLNMRCRIVLRTQKGTLILTTTHMLCKDLCINVSGELQVGVAPDSTSRFPVPQFPALLFLQPFLLECLGLPIGCRVVHLLNPKP